MFELETRRVGVLRGVRRGRELWLLSTAFSSLLSSGGGERKEKRRVEKKKSIGTQLLDSNERNIFDLLYSGLSSLRTHTPREVFLAPP